MIETERLILRPQTPDDFDNVQRLWSLAHEDNGLAGTPIPREESIERRTRQVGLWDEQGYGMFTWCDRRNGAFVGEGGLSHFQREYGPAFDKSPEAAWALMPDYQGRRFAYEAMVAVHEWYAGRFGEARTVCIINPGNNPSVRLAQRLGYRPFDEAEYRDAPVTLFERSVDLE
ncbi:GNAT family N-acetyltransferase [Stakelama sp. CBK3Z-3]|uniref:GNAT family N-acetyltransferase n=1 Tax=Stakelama flava TaxID=2860338 RepID=A0ABS6XKE4_9SPHN|nr:GNAT family N-acetyltransferase [Stakelama flava]MBW4330636.1 GNAT family N-acetyltransferase [Stakelama flava]